MTDAWTQDAAERPSAKQVVQRLEALLLESSSYSDLSAASPSVSSSEMLKASSSSSGANNNITQSDSTPLDDDDVPLPSGSSISNDCIGGSSDLHSIANPHVNDQVDKQLDEFQVNDPMITAYLHSSLRP